MRRWQGVFGVVLSTILCGIIAGSAQAAMIIDTPYWAADSYSNELTAVNYTRPSLPCSYGTYPVFPGGSQQLCVVGTDWGEVSSSGLIRFAGETMFQYYDIGYRMSALPIGGSNRLYVKQRLENSDAFRVGYISEDMLTGLKDGSTHTFDVTYLQYNEERTLYDSSSYQFLSSGRILHDLIFTSVGFSSDQKRIFGVASSFKPSTTCWYDSQSGTECEPQVYDLIYVSYNLSTDTIAVFIDDTMDESAPAESSSLSITEDGRGAAVVTNTTLRIYALEETQSTSATSQTIIPRTHVANVLSTKAVGGDDISAAYFTDGDKTLTYLVRHGSRTDQMKLRPSNADYPSDIDNYLGIGDSFSSGEGVLSYRLETNYYLNDGMYNTCHQSTLSYPYLIDAVVMPDKFGSIACSGARLRDVIYDQKLENTSEPYKKNNPQAQGFDYSNTAQNDLINSTLLPGYIDQIQLLDYRKPSVATVSIGGNDIGFTDIVKQCITRKVMPNLPIALGDCYGQRDERETLANEIDSKIPLLTQVFRELIGNMSGERRLYVVGYPSIVADKAVCTDAISAVERNRANDIVEYLNAAVAQAASNAGAYYVDVTNAFVVGDNDYRLCGNQSPTAANSIVLNSPSMKKPNKLLGLISNPVDNESYHPNLIGHILLTRTIRQQTNDLTTPMPAAPDEDINAVSDFLREQFVGDTETNVTTKTSNSDSITTQTIYKKPGNTVKNFFTSIFKYIASSVRLEIHSDPIYLGTFTPSADGTVEGEYSLPADLPIGYHELHFIYTDTSGQEQDVYQTVFVLESPDDWDGDGIPNTEEANCAIGDNSSFIDNNGDGYNDSCIPYIANGSDTQPTADQLVEQASKNGALTPEEIALVYRASKKTPTTTVTAQQQPSQSSEPADTTSRPASSSLLKDPQTKTSSHKPTNSIESYALKVVVVLLLGLVTTFIVVKIIARRRLNQRQL